LNHNSSAALKEATEKATKSSMKIGEAIYRNAGQQQQQTNTNT
jgi:hypothetical protein